MLQLVLTRSGSTNGDLHINISITYLPSDGASAGTGAYADLIILIIFPYIVHIFMGLVHESNLLCHTFIIRTLLLVLVVNLGSQKYKV